MTRCFMHDVFDAEDLPQLTRTACCSQDQIWCVLPRGPCSSWCDLPVQPFVPLPSAGLCMNLLRATLCVYCLQTAASVHGCSVSSVALQLPSNYCAMCRFEGLASRGVLFSCSCQLDSNDGCCTFKVERKGT